MVKNKRAPGSSHRFDRDKVISRTGLFQYTSSQPCLANFGGSQSLEDIPAANSHTYIHAQINSRAPSPLPLFLRFSMLKKWSWCRDELTLARQVVPIYLKQTPSMKPRQPLFCSWNILVEGIRPSLKWSEKSRTAW